MKDFLRNDLNKRIALFFDHQMNQEDELEFLKQIQSNPAGHQAFLKEKSIREKIKENLYKPTRSNILADQIKDRIKKYPGQ